MKAIIPAAGLGTRFLPATKAQPKEMLPVLDKPVIQYVVEEALAAGASEVVIVTSAEKPSIREHFSAAPKLESFLTKNGKSELAAAVAHAGSLPVSFALQQEALGLGHAVLCAAEATVAEPFYVLLGDVIVPDNDILPRMKAVSDAHNGASVLAVFAVPYEQVSRFGVIAKEPVLSSENTEDVCNAESSRPTSDELVLSSENTEDVWRITSLVEKPSVDKAPSNLAIFGRYLLSPRVMQILAQTKPGAGGEIQLTDALAELLHSEEMYALVISSSSGFDTGTVQSWLETNVSMAQRRAI